MLSTGRRRLQPIIVRSNDDPGFDLDLYYGKVKFCDLGFSRGKSENSGFCSETVAASDLGRSRHLIEFMKVCGY